MQPYKVLIVDDSAFMRRMVSDLISDDPDFIVIGTAKHGQEAIEMNTRLKPDVITMDVEMPVMNGLDALRSIMKTRPVPVIMLSSLTHAGALETIEALQFGAVDFVQKPSGSISLDIYKVKVDLLQKLHTAMQAKVRQSEVREEKASLFIKNKRNVQKNGKTTPGSSSEKHIVAIGTSTGGPRALQKVLCQLPSDFAAPIVIVQHMPPRFTKSLAQRLDSLSAIRVVEAEDHMVLESGTAYIAPGGMHMLVKGGGNETAMISLNQNGPKSGHRPSVDVLFESLLPLRYFKRHIVLMTGMGSDGAKGMKLLKENGAATTIAESEETCVVYGMPRSAVQLGVVDEILKNDDIAEALIRVTRSK